MNDREQHVNKLIVDAAAAEGLALQQHQLEVVELRPTVFSVETAFCFRDQKAAELWVKRVNKHLPTLLLELVHVRSDGTAMMRAIEVKP